MEQTTSEMVNKYDIFYKCVKQFLTQTNIASQNHIMGMSSKEIDAYGIDLPLAIKKYFEHFGSNFENEGSCFPTLPFKSFLKANSEVKRVPDALSIMQEYVDPVLPFEWDQDRYSLYFCNQNEENPMPLYLEEFDEVHNLNYYHSFTNFIRGRLFSSISSKLYGLNKKTKSYEVEIDDNINVASLKWADYYYKFYTHEYGLKHKLSANTLYNNRRDFYKIIAEEEKKGNFLYCVDEFEIKFIEYLKSKTE